MRAEGGNADPHDAVAARQLPAWQPARCDERLQRVFDEKSLRVSGHRAAQNVRHVAGSDGSGFLPASAALRQWDEQAARVLEPDGSTACHAVDYATTRIGDPQNFNSVNVSVVCESRQSFRLKEIEFKFDQLSVASANFLSFIVNLKCPTTRTFSPADHGKMFSICAKFV